MSESSPDDIREAIGARMLAEEAEVPTGSWRRLGRMGLTMLRMNRLSRRETKARRTGKDRPPVDPETIVKLVTSIGRLKGIAMKMGQIMSYIDVTLPDEVSAALSALQTHAQTMPPDQVRQIIGQELGARAGDLLAELQFPPIAAASIGQVHRGRLPGGREVAVKVQYPEVRRAMENDFGPASFGSKIASLFYPGAKIDSFLQEARERFLAECDYEREAAWQARFRSIYAAHPLIVVPPVHRDYSSQAVLTTGWIDGKSFDAFLATDPPQETRDRIGVALFEFYLGTLFRHGLYNGDPHPGNYLFPDDGRLAMLDYGCARDFPTSFVAKLVDLTRAVHEDDPGEMHRALVALGVVREGKKYNYDLARSMFRAFYGPMLADQTAAIDLGEGMSFGEMASKKRDLMRFSFPGEFLFLFRIRFGLFSVLARLGARANWYRLERGYIDAAAAAHADLHAD